jgi:putative FmdB family regulatory protein
MPIYDYHCDGCGADFERLVRGDTIVACPKCEGRKVERRMSLPARRAGGGEAGPDLSRLGPPPGGCCGGGCGHSH